MTSLPSSNTGTAEAIEYIDQALEAIAEERGYRAIKFLLKAKRSLRGEWEKPLFENGYISPSSVTI